MCGEEAQGGGQQQRGPSIARRQEKLVTNSSIPHSIVHATQFFEFIQRIADSFTTGDTVRVPRVLVQPMAGDDVASAIATVSVCAALSGSIETANWRFCRSFSRNAPRSLATAK